MPKRTTKALLGDAQVLSVDDGTMTLEFPRAWGAQRFSDGVNSELVREALTSVLGVDWKVRAVTREGEPISATAPASAAPAASVEDVGIADDDEPVGASNGGGPRPGDDPVALLKSGLGATVISEHRPD